MVPNSWSSDKEPILADLEQRSDLHLFCNGAMVKVLQHFPTQHVLELGLVLLLVVQSFLPYKELPVRILNPELTQERLSVYFSFLNLKLSQQLLAFNFYH